MASDMSVVSAHRDETIEAIGPRRPVLEGDRLPALDGLRGVAVLLVLAAHFGVPLATGGGGTGVVIFFVLSGYLITSLLMREREETGRIAKWPFLQRRMKRLLPALGIVAAVTLGASVALGDIEHVGPQAFRALLYHANTAPVSEPLGHAWTLSVEEQFYLAWPAFLTVGSPLIALPAIGLLLAGFQLAAFGAIAAGATLAAVRPGPLPGWMAIVGGEVILLATMTGYGPADVVWIRLGIVAAALVLILTALRPLPILSTAPLRYVGRISYGLYLWHIPVRWAVVSVGLWPMLGVPITFVIAALSWAFIEAPILRSGFGRRQWRVPTPQ